jgi:hypothetical protein
MHGSNIQGGVRQIINQRLNAHTKSCLGSLGVKGDSQNLQARRRGTASVACTLCSQSSSQRAPMYSYSMVSTGPPVRGSGQLQKLGASLCGPSASSSSILPPSSAPTSQANHHFSLQYRLASCGIPRPRRFPATRQQKRSKNEIPKWASKNHKKAPILT